MLVIKAFINSFQEFQTILSDHTNIIKPTSLIFKTSGHPPGLFSLGNSNIEQNFNSNQSIFRNVNSDEVINCLKKDGFFLGINLPQQVVQEINTLVRDMPCYGNKQNDKSFYYHDKETAHAKYEENFVTGIYCDTDLIGSVIQKLESDPTLLEIAAKYLGTKSIYRRHQLWWKFAEESSIFERRRAAQLFYDNSNGCRSIKFFFYLTDVNLCSSPHVCVRGSHLKKKLSHLFFHRGLSYKEITQYYGYKNIVPICGQAGFGFVEDTRCFQKENPPGSKDRLMLQIEFAAKHYRSQSNFREVSQ